MLAPNPASNLVTIEFSLPREEEASVGIYDARGRLVVEILDDILDAGRHTIMWTRRNSRGLEVAPGVYFARLATPSQTVTKKVLIVR